VNPTEELILGEQRVLFTGSASGKPRWECRFDQVTELLTFSHSDSGSEGSSHVALKLRTNIPQSVGTYVRKFELYPEDVLRLVDFLHHEGLERILPK
jgi:hypothetical protein